MMAHYRTVAVSALGGAGKVTLTPSRTTLTPSPIPVILLSGRAYLLAHTATAAISREVGLNHQRPEWCLEMPPKRDDG